MRPVSSGDQSQSMTRDRSDSVALAQSNDRIVTGLCMYLNILFNCLQSGHSISPVPQVDYERIRVRDETDYTTPLHLACQLHAPRCIDLVRDTANNMAQYLNF